jgi:hypothetical protein
MTIEEILKHPRVHQLEINWTPEDEFTVYPSIYDEAGFPVVRKPISGYTLQAALTMVARRIEKLKF